MSKKRHTTNEPAPQHAAPAGPQTDVGQIELGGLPIEQFPTARVDEYRVAIAEGAFRDIRRHAESDTSVELCGVLAGKLLKDDTGPFLLVQEAISGANTRRTGSQVTFTHETWDQIHSRMADDFPDLAIVGWYHTHPGFGIFLSDMDQFIQDNFFNLPHQVAFVYDPKSDERGLFIWRGGKSSRLRRYWLGEELCYDLQSDAGGAPGTETAMKVTVPGVRSAEHRPMPVGPHMQEGELTVKATWLLAALAALMLAFWLGGSVGRTGGTEQHEQVRSLENLARAGMFRDGLDGSLAGVSGELTDLRARVRGIQAALAQAGKPGQEGKPPVDVSGELGELVADVERTQGRLKSVADRYTACNDLAKRMNRVVRMDDQIMTLQACIGEICILQARALLDQTDEATLARRAGQAAMYAQLAKGLLPEQLRHKVDSRLPELVPKQSK